MLTVRARILVAFLALVAVLVSFVAVFAPRRLSAEFNQSVHKVGAATCDLLGAQLAAAVEFEDEDTLKEALAGAKRVQDVAYVEVRDVSGKLLAAVGTRPDGLEQLPVNGAATIETISHVIAQRRISSDDNDAALGTVRVAMSLARLESKKAELNELVLFVALFVVAVGLLVGLVLDRMIARPVQLVTRAVREVARGELGGDNIDIQSNDEFGELAAAFNRMRRDLGDAQGKLEQAANDADDRASQLVRANRDLAGLNTQLEEFAYAASHDLRAPLHAIGQLVEFIEEDIEGIEGVEEETKTHMRLIRQRTKRMQDLLTNLLEYARVGRAGVEPEEVDLGTLVSDVIDMLSPPDGFTVIVSDAMPVITTGRAPLERVMLNLISNAVKHHDKPDGRIDVSAHIEGDVVLVSVEDDGPGIPDRLKDKAFKMFVQLNRKDKEKGTGMGLAMIRKIIDTAGGNIRLESTGRGCTFRFEWPCVWQPRARPVND